MLVCQTYVMSLCLVEPDTFIICSRISQTSSPSFSTTFLADLIVVVMPLTEAYQKYVA